MADARFFKKSRAFSLAEIAGLTGATLLQPEKAGARVEDVAPLDAAVSGHLSFLDNRKYLESFRKTRASACFVRQEFAGDAPDGVACLVAASPYMAYALAAQAFYPETPVAEAAGISSQAFVHPEATLGAGCDVGPFAVIEKGAVIGKNSRIQAHAVIGAGVVIGDDCDIGYHASVTHCIMGNRVRIYPGARIGQPGFGFAIDAKGFVTVPQLGRVLIEDDVEVGANTTVDRGAGPDTVLGKGTRIDNLVQIAHNVKTGRNCVMAAQTGVAGSTELGDFVMTGGQVGILGHIKIGSGARLAAQTGVMRDLQAGGEYMGSPALPLKDHMRQVAWLNRAIREKRKKREE